MGGHPRRACRWSLRGRKLRGNEKTGRFEGEGDERALVVAGAGVGSDVWMHGKIVGSPLEDGSGHVRVKAALAVLARNKWLSVQSSVGEMRIRLGERAPKLNGADVVSRS